MTTGLYIATLSRPDIGGIQEHNHQVAEQLMEMGECIMVLARSKPGDQEFDKTSGYPVTRYDTNVGDGDGWKFPLDRSRLFAEILKANTYRKSDYLVLDTMRHPTLSVQVVLASKLLRKPLFLYIHSAETALIPAPSAMAEFSRRLTLHASNRVICVSNYLKSLVSEHSKLDPRKVTTIRNGANLSEIDAYLSKQALRKYKGDGPVIVTVSRLDRRKGIDRVIEAMSKIVSDIPNARYVIVGGGDDECHLKNLAAGSPAKDSISFVGPQDGDRKFEFYKQSDVFAMPSRYHEGGAIVFAEAGAFGKPVISGNLGGQKEMILHEVTGLLVDPESSNAIAEAILRILKNPEEAASLGENGRRRVEDEFNWKLHATKLLSIIHQEIGNKE
jgi:glycosyltransferase involved in cell wall biosynthesis